MLSALGVLFDGLAYGCLLFLIGIGLSVTMGLMRSSTSRTGPSPWRAATCAWC